MFHLHLCATIWKHGFTNMVAYSLKQKIFIVKRFYQNGNSVEIVKNEFLCEFEKTKSPTDNIIVELVKLFEEFGSILTKHDEKQINNGQSTHSLEKVDLVNIVKCKNIHENEEWNLLRARDCIETEIEPQGIFQTDTQDHNDTENRLPTNENSLHVDNFSDNDDLKPLNEIRSQLRFDRSLIVEKEENCNLNVEDSNTNKNDGSDVTNTKKEDDDALCSKILKCEKCDKEFNRKRNYLRHINSHKKSCEICGETYRQYKKHMMKHSGEKPYKCNECGAHFMDMSRLKGHLTTHSNARPFECDLCKKTFKSRDRLRGHIKTHLKDRPIKCEICGKGFLHNGVLKKHSRTHTGEKPYVCSFCGKCFGSSTSLKVHNRTHTGEMPYKCNICDKQFNASGSLTIHKRIHTGEKPYKCKFCEKSFYDNATCKVHVRTHTGDYPYKCVLCGKAHNHPSNLKSHMRHAHREEQG